MTDRQLHDEVGRLVQRDWRALSELLVHLGELDGRRLYAVHGCSSMTAYLIQVFGFSEDAAGKRVRAARLARRFPAIIDRVASGQLHLSGIAVLATSGKTLPSRMPWILADLAPRQPLELQGAVRRVGATRPRPTSGSPARSEFPRTLLGRHLTDDNHQELLAEASGKTRRAIEIMVADRAPKPSVPSSIRRLPTAKTPTPSPSLFDETQAPPASAAAPAAPAERTARSQRPPVERPPAALGADRFKVGFTASGRLVGKIERLKALMSHAVPTGALDEVFERAIDIAIEAVEKQRYGSKKRRRSSKKPGSKTGRAIPAAVRREVFERDRGRCTFVSKGGRRCDETRFLELDHIEPFGVGGKHVASNVRLRCRGHNLRAAVEHYGQHAIGARRQAPGPVGVDGRCGR